MTNNLAVNSAALQRAVRKVSPTDEPPSGGDPGLFSQYLGFPNIILLGDPGSGKTHTFKAAAKEEGAEFLSVRQFLATEGTRCEHRTVYLDGLDEFRSRIDDKNLVIQVIQLLGRIDRPRLRLSCRVADWLGKTDLSLFEHYFSDTAYAVLILEPLSEEEVATIASAHGIENPVEFVQEARERGLERLLGNPQTLIMLSEVVGNGTWPETKLELYEAAIPTLLKEHNQERVGPGLGRYRPEELIAPTGAVCASLLISGAAGISLLENCERADFPTYRSVPFDDLDKVQACLMRRAFSGDEQEVVSCIHRTIAEFMAAKWVTTQVRNGLPIRRIQSLMGIEGHPAAELRGLHAWLATLLPEHAAILIENDPYGVLMYGDPASLAPSDRKSLLRSLETLSETDPWFRSTDWSDRPLGALSGPDMVDEFQRILSDPTASFHLRSVVLDAIRNGPPLPQMRAVLRRILEDPEAAYHDRLVAVDALLKVIPDGECEIAEVVRSTLASDPASARLRGGNPCPNVLQPIQPG